MTEPNGEWLCELRDLGVKRIDVDPICATKLVCNISGLFSPNIPEGWKPGMIGNVVGIEIYEVA